ncbi:dihydroneopterin aldolase [Sulfurovum lithotrophicum]|uniref:Dihydroneopterin aldolase n=1 Tax=Sulfurovum lithotrophicum TaxID=206403 RepID=A0A7U4M010_9BACT|nr:dihydroneopterin aldolase [Sulfurovum lithotrophicum]AKF24317.1 dihydroneopterin aldolase [Sulfurovum lithotrophicum]
MTIHIEALTLDIIIGLLDFEREHTQRVIIDMTADYAYNEESFVDYGDIVILIEKELKEKRYELLEEALLGLKSIITSTYPQITDLTLKITKPNILPQCHVALSNHWILN